MESMIQQVVVYFLEIAKELLKNIMVVHSI